MAVKQVIVIRKDLNMRKGKMAAQASHASMGVLYGKWKNLGKELVVPIWPEAMDWFLNGTSKVVVGVDSLDELLELRDKAREAGLHFYMVTDAGKTEFHGAATVTALAIGPHKAEKIDPITGALKLL